MMQNRNNNLVYILSKNKDINYYNFITISNYMYSFI